MLWPFMNTKPRVCCFVHCHCLTCYATGQIGGRRVFSSLPHPCPFFVSRLEILLQSLVTKNQDVFPFWSPATLPVAISQSPDTSNNNQQHASIIIYCKLL